MLRLLALVAALLSPAALLVPHPEEHSQAPPEPEPGYFTSLTLPAASSWVAAPYTAVGDVRVWIWTTQPGHAAGARHAADSMFLSIEGRDGLLMGGGWGMGSHAFEVNAKGERVACCDLALGDPADPSTGQSDVWLRDGETVWVAFIAANADTSQPFEISLATEGGELAPGLAREGTDVQLIDLVDEAYANGINVRVSGRTLVGSPAPIDLAFTPTKNGFVTLGYSAEDVEMDLTLRAGDITVIDGPAAQGGFAGALGYDGYEVSLALHSTAKQELLGGEQPWAIASLLYADIDVPGTALQHHEWES